MVKNTKIQRIHRIVQNHTTKQWQADECAGVYILLIKISSSTKPSNFSSKFFPKNWGGGDIQKLCLSAFFPCNEVQLSPRSQNRLGLPFHSSTHHLVCPFEICLSLLIFPFCLSYSFKSDYTHQPEPPDRIPRPSIGPQSQPLGPNLQIQRQLA